MKRVIRQRLSRASVLVVAVGLFVVVAPAAAHAVTGLQYTTASSAFDSTTPKSIVAFCPSGTVAINGGAYITGATGSVTLRQVVPLQAFGAYFVSVVAEEDPDGYAGSWSVNATAVCVPPPAGLSYVTASLTDYYIWVVAPCGSKRIIGGGYMVSAGAWAKAAGVQVDSKNRAYVSVELSDVPPVAQPITGTAVAVCADAPLPGMRWLSTSTPMNSLTANRPRPSARPVPRWSA